MYLSDHIMDRLSSHWLSPHPSFSSCFVSSAPCAFNCLVVTVLFLEFWYTIAFFSFAFYSRHFQNMMNLIYPSPTIKKLSIHSKSYFIYTPPSTIISCILYLLIILKLIPDIMLSFHLQIFWYTFLKGKGCKEQDQSTLVPPKLVIP